MLIFQILLLINRGPLYQDDQMLKFLSNWIAWADFASLRELYEDVVALFTNRLNVTSLQENTTSPFLVLISFIESLFGPDCYHQNQFCSL